MSALFDLLYREYCRARLAEMRKQLLLIDSHEVPNCDADRAAADQSCDSSGRRDEAAAEGHFWSRSIT
jgi:hypothetical protein